MFDIGFWELMLIGVVALLVVGPERLPQLARTAGLWIGKGQRFLSSVKADIDREMRTTELKRILDQQNQRTGLEEIIEETKGAFKEAETADQARRVQSSSTESKESKPAEKPDGDQPEHGGK